MKPCRFRSMTRLVSALTNSRLRHREAATSRYIYDSRGRVISTTNRKTVRSTQSFDGAGRAIRSAVDEAGRVIVTSYDARRAANGEHQRFWLAQPATTLYQYAVNSSR
ncbi:MAG: hypothetical protein U0670_08730 [Anaerolineae bacterium]